MLASSAPLPWSAVALCFVAMFFVMGARTGFAVLYPRIVADVGWTVAEVTGAFSAGLFVYAPMAVVAGIVLDRFGSRFSMLVGSVCITVGMATVASATELWHLYVAFILINGIGSPAVGFITVIKVLSMRAGDRFATAFGVAFMGQGAGSLVMSPAVQAVVDAAGWRAGALVMGILVVLVLAPMAALFAPGREHVPEPKREAGAGAGDSGVALFLVLLLSNAGLGFLMLIPTHQVAYLLDLGLAPFVAASAAGAWGAMMSIGSLLGGWAMDRWGLARMLIWACVAFALGTAAVLYAGPAAMPIVIAYVIASGIGRGMLSVVLGAQQTRAYAGPRLGRMTGLMDLGFGTGAFLGPWLTALVHDAAGTFAPGFLAAIVSALMMAVTAAIVDRLLREPARSHNTG